jgi:hypothetical protein
MSEDELFEKYKTLGILGQGYRGEVILIENKKSKEKFALQIYRWQFKNLKLQSLECIRRHQRLQQELGGSLCTEICEVIQEKKDYNGECF